MRNMMRSNFIVGVFLFPLVYGECDVTEKSHLLLLIPFQVTILDSKKSMNIGIFLRHFKR